MSGLRLLLLADSHLGFDLPLRPRTNRRRRGYDFLANHAAALAPALAGDVDMVVHGGDVFDRPRVPASLAYQAYEPLLRAAERGVPVLIVPGNHERSRLPHSRFVRHANIHVFDRARTVRLQVGGRSVALAGFPYERRHVRTRFGQLLESTEWTRHDADLRLLCLHHCVEGATVGPGNFTFTGASDVIRCRDLPLQFDAVVSGHIHRAQVLTRDLAGGELAAPVLYPGSIERTSMAEIGEPKGYMILHFEEGKSLRWEWRPLPARLMIARKLVVAELSAAQLDDAVRRLVAQAPADAVLRIRLVGQLAGAGWRVLSARHLRTFVPATMNLDITSDDPARFARRRRPPAPHSEPVNLQLEL